jgi:5-methylcytosine-specific restriction endonuclease McrA
MTCQLFNPDLKRDQKIAQQVRERDKVCRKCFAKYNLDCHHIVKLRDGGEDTVINQVLLCPHCHKVMENKTLKYGLTRFERALLEENMRNENANLKG